MRSCAVLLTVWAVGWATVPLAAQPGDRLLELNLAMPTLFRTVDPGSYRLRITNRLPDENYTVEVLREAIPIPAFPNPWPSMKLCCCDHSVA